MCGIAGILDPRGVGEAEVRAMADRLAHRGPDDATVHLEPGLGFGFRRLSIIDLEGGRQPIGNEDGTLQVILNGEIYNYGELRSRLKAAGHQFATHSDTEVLVHLYEDLGSGLVDELRGMFAFALWDRPRRRLLVARDHLGQKPLFWARRGERFLFASEIKAILAAEPSFRELDPFGLHDYLSLRVIADPRSMFRGVHKLAPGELLEIEAGGEPEIRRYWSLAYEPKPPISETEALASLEEAVKEAVRLHLVADVEVGAFLSGGIDSGLVVALAAGAFEGRLSTFSIATPYGRFDESDAARSVSERYGTRHHEEAVSGDLVELLPSVTYHLDEPSDPLSACLWALARMTSRHVKVAMGGDGGDELFGGYDRYYGVLYARWWALLPRAVREGVIGRIADRASDGNWYKSLSHQVHWLNELADAGRRHRYARSLSYFYFTPERRRELYTDSFREQVEAVDPEQAIVYWQDEARVKEALDRMLLADSMVRLPNHSVMILDRMTMAHGLEARSPFLDHRLAEFAATLPVRLKVRGTHRRYLQMKLAKKYLPPEVLGRPKQGFSSALPYMMQSQFETLFGHFLPGSHLVEAGLLRPEPIARMLQEHTSGREDHGNRLWLLLHAEIWHRVHIEETGYDALLEEIREVLGRGGRPSAESASTAARPAAAS